MRTWGAGTRAWVLSSTFLFSCPLVASGTQAAQFQGSDDATANQSALLNHPPGSRLNASIAPSHAMYSSRYGAGSRLAGARLPTRSYGISCVPYAREVSGINVSGDAWQWWNHADGLYARGDRPEVGSVLNFRANGRMRLGHVAVVMRVVNPREVVVDHANWPSGGMPGRISRNVTVVDVSEANNWSAVRVELGRSGDFGSVYPTYGFIYNRPGTGFVTSRIVRPAPQPAINPVLSDLRPVAERSWHTMEEVAEAPPTSPRRSDGKSKQVTLSSGK